MFSLKNIKSYYKLIRKGQTENGAKDIPRGVHTHAHTNVLSLTGAQGTANRVHTEKLLHLLGWRN